MPWVTPSTVNTGDTLQASTWNQDVVENTKVLRALANVQSKIVTVATFSRQASTFADITDLSISITPTATTSKVLVTVSLNFGTNATADFYHLRLMRDSTAIAIGDAVGSRERITVGSGINNAVELQNRAIIFLDSPNTTSATTYKMQVKNTNGAAAGIFYLNRTSTDTDGVYGRAVSSITVQEIPA